MAVGYRSNSLFGTSDSFGSTINLPVPAGVAADDIIVLYVGQYWDINATFPTVTVTGFTQFAQVSSVNAQVTGFWKRASGADTGNYVVNFSTSNWANAFCVAITGAETVGSPIGTNFDTDIVASSTSFPSLSVTTTEQPFLVWGCYNSTGASITVPTGYTRPHSASTYGSLGYRIPGSTGTHTASGGACGSTSQLVDILAAVSPPSGAPRESKDITDIGSTAWQAPANSTSISPTYPSGLQEGDVVYMFLHTKPSTATPTTPTNWTLVDSIAATHTAAQGAGTGPTRMTIFKRIVPAGGLTGSQAVTVTGGSSLTGHMKAFRATGTNLAWEEAVGGWSVPASGTTGSTTQGGTASPAVSTAVKDIVCVMTGTSDDQSTTLAVTGISATGSTFGTLTQDPSGTVINAQGNDISSVAYDVPVTAGSSSVGPTVTATSSSAETGMGIVLRVRATGEVVTGTTYDGAATLSATATLTADASPPIKVGAVSLSVGTTLTAQPTPIVGAASLTAGVVLSAAGRLDAFGAVALTATPTLAADGVRLVDGAVTLTATGVLSPSGAVARAGEANLAVSVSLSAGALVPGGAASLTAVVGLSVAGVRTTDGAVALTVGSSISAGAFLVEFASASLSVSSSLVAGGLRTTAGAVVLSAVPTLNANPFGAGGSASLSATYSLVAGAWLVEFGAVSLSAVGVLTADGVRTTFGATNLAASATLTANASGVLFASVSASAVCILSVSGALGARGVVSLGILSSLIADTAGAGGSVTLVVGKVLTVNGITSKAGSVNLASAYLLNVSSALGAFGIVQLDASTSLVTDGYVYKIGAATLLASSILSVTGALQIPGAVSIIAAALLQFIEVFPFAGFGTVTGGWNTIGIRSNVRRTPRLPQEKWVTAGIHVG